MASFTKWLGAGLGFTMGGPIGAAIGYAVGSFVDGFSVDDFKNDQKKYRQSGGHRNSYSGDFEISLLVLASVVIKADDKIDQRELDFVRRQFIQMYGQQRAENAFKLFKGVIKKQVSTRQICIQIRQNISHASRLQLLHFLFGIANADQNVSQSEVDEIRKIAGYLYINQYDFESIKAMFYQDADNAYKMLEIDKNVSDSEVKKAYRKMAKKYHPDKLRNLGEEHLKGAKEKFQNIQQAYEKVKNERGM